MTPTQQRDLSAWLTVFNQKLTRLNEQTKASVRAAYSDVDDWLSPPQTVAAASAAMTASRVSQQMHAGLMSEFTSVMIEILTGRRPSSPRIEYAYPRDADPFDVYSRPVFTARDIIDLSDSPDIAAINAAVQAEFRAEMLALTDAALARREAAVQTMQAAKITHYRRVIHPEISIKTGVCGLCIAAAAQVYRVENLQPLHSGCNCTQAPIAGRDDPGEEWNRTDMEALYKSLDRTTRQELAKVRFEVVQTELGPTLVQIGTTVPRAAAA